ncbi:MULTISPECIES: L-seryl-tRNA(Sec) selenium transferase [Methylobacterium]|uniref:L-seryl-tRNA(Sec) selenium transferase n=1 Tax=Methylobacterium jeotgali TaxID=381630 RepID=A0ABQ4SZC9_9HYPH|nr:MULTISPECIES: L-seryl-tRNA(Sec) selenium transferase [Methylobacterium]PIU08016.1 MAG: L-seryl-tRNA(Sec) selenium transferase [Methylobacterium sp. CG09_land_8_20_14_0_10_71_15]PIU15802.1 MAG: L-seryl-tRNA(Sec) selenium transferase [Methylobacterium sp. CG08_land_8_20_14_0_20_71_15]GBU17909.1 selenocysteine synthase [Methylobacterium sp.]GJE08561.1 L-seryl-tRNA(Sec) selenium transferase [Methylobacterium jeotgali]
MSRTALSAETRPPSVERLLAHEAAAASAEAYGRTALTEAIRAVLAAIREGHEPLAESEELIARAEARLERESRPSLRRVLNLTGTVLHTNLGRAPLPPEAVEAVAAVMTGASNLEYDLVRGERGERDSHVEALICRLTGAEAAVVVNNNAAAVLLVLNALAMRREVVVSRGELVEIGGSFRVPDVMVRAGCRLREVGTTNRTHLADYAEAIGPRTGLVMKVHPSNYEVTGFTAEADAAALKHLCAERGVPFVNDLGSGNLIDFAAYGLPPEPTVGRALAESDLVTFSGDKLLGAVQCGIVAGRADLVAKVRKNPLKRALRVDKMTYAALGAVLRLYLHPERLKERLPTLRLLTREETAIRTQAERLLPGIAARLGDRARVTVEPCSSQIGSGALPVETLPSASLVLRPPSGPKGEGAWLKLLAASLRALPVPVIGRVGDGALRLDLRTLEDEAELLAQFEALAI